MRWKARGSGSAGLRKENLPLALALQGFALTVLALFVAAPPVEQVQETAAVGMGAATQTGSRVASDPWMPTDLQRERIRLPRFPNPRERSPQPQPAPSPRETQESLAARQILDSLRIDSVAIQAPVPVRFALALPDAPDILSPGAISSRGLGEGPGPGLRRPGRGGWGGDGIGGVGGPGVIVGFGEGPNCHPRRPVGPSGPWGPSGQPVVPRDPVNPVHAVPPHPHW